MSYEVTCEFCSTLFEPRPQTKNPRACNNNNNQCQRERQRANEREWREKNQSVYDSEYHEIQKDKRAKQIEEAYQLILKCLETGSTFLNQKTNFNEFMKIFYRIFFSLGVKRINKLCPPDKLNNLKSLSSAVIKCSFTDIKTKKLWAFSFSINYLLTINFN